MTTLKKILDAHPLPVILARLNVGRIRKQLENERGKPYKGKDLPKSYPLYEYENPGFLIGHELMYTEKDEGGNLEYEYCRIYACDISDLSDLNSLSTDEWWGLDSLIVIENYVRISCNERKKRETLEKVYRELTGMYHDFVETGLKDRYKVSNRRSPKQLKSDMQEHIKRLNEYNSMGEIILRSHIRGHDINRNFAIMGKTEEDISEEDISEEENSAQIVKSFSDAFGIPINLSFLDESYLNISDEAVPAAGLKGQEYEVFCHIHAIHKDEEGTLKAVILAYSFETLIGDKSQAWCKYPPVTVLSTAINLDPDNGRSKKQIDGAMEFLTAQYVKAIKHIEYMKKDDKHEEIPRVYRSMYGESFSPIAKISLLDWHFQWLLKNTAVRQFATSEIYRSKSGQENFSCNSNEDIMVQYNISLREAREEKEEELAKILEKHPDAMYRLLTGKELKDGDFEDEELYRYFEHK